MTLSSFRRALARHQMRAYALIPLLLFCWFSSVRLLAQPWEYVYGGDWQERGHDVAKVTHCGSGYIAVGQSNSLSNDCSNPTPSDEDVYVVRTALNGTRIWEYRYNIGTGTTDDVAHAVVELSDGSGFVITGVVEIPGGATSDIFLLKIDCDGQLVWVQRHNPGQYDVGFDVIEAAFGTAGDLIVCGTTQTAAGTYDGLIFRTTAAGAVIWSSQILLGGPAGTSDELFYAVKEIAGQTGQGDIVAAGGANFTVTPPGVQGYVARVSGVTGLIGAAPQGLALYGGANTETFLDVIELTVGANAGNLLFVGLSETPTAGATSDIYVVKTAANPCILVAQRTIDQFLTPGVADDVAREVVEVTQPGMFPQQNGFVVGDLALVGYTDYLGIGGRSVEMLLLPVAVNSLAPYRGVVYGDASSGSGIQREEGHAIVQESQGFVLCGRADGNLEQDATPDWQDLYLVRTDPDGLTDCQQEPDFVDTDPGWLPTCPTSVVVTVNPITTPQTTRLDLSSAVNCCPRVNHNRCCPLCKPVVAGAEGKWEKLSLQQRPAPIRRGSVLRVDIIGLAEQGATLVLSDLAGREVLRREIAPSSHGGVEITTDELTPGSYVLIATAGRRTAQSKLLVLP